MSATSEPIKTSDLNEVPDGWLPIEAYNLGDRVPVLLCDPNWYQSGHKEHSSSKVAQGFFDQHLNGWNICLFEPCSAYAWVTYYSKDFKPKFWRLYPKPPEF